MNSKKIEKSAGKGSSPRNCFSKNYKNNYDLINWSNKKQKKNTKYANSNSSSTKS